MRPRPISTNRARSATQAQAARTSSGRETELMEKREIQVRRATAEDAAALGRLLHDFNREFDEPTPAPEVISARLRHLFEADEIIGLLAGAGPDGLALLRFRPA